MRGNENRIKGRSIKTYLLITIIMLAIIPVTIIGIISTTTSRKANEKSFDENGVLLCNISQEIINNKTTYYENVLETVIKNGKFNIEESPYNNLKEQMNLNDI